MLGRILFSLHLTQTHSDLYIVQTEGVMCQWITKHKQKQRAPSIQLHYDMEPTEPSL